MELRLLLPNANGRCASCLETLMGEGGLLRGFVPWPFSDCPPPEGRPCSPVRGLTACDICVFEVAVVDISPPERAGVGAAGEGSISDEPISSQRAREQGQAGFVPISFAGSVYGSGAPGLRRHDEAVLCRLIDMTLSALSPLSPVLCALRGNLPLERVLYCSLYRYPPRSWLSARSLQRRARVRSFPARAGPTVGGLEYAGTESDRSVAPPVLSGLPCVASGLSDTCSCLAGRCKGNEAVRAAAGARPTLIRPTKIRPRAQEFSSKSPLTVHTIDYGDRNVLTNYMFSSSSNRTLPGFKRFSGSRARFTVFMSANVPSPSSARRYLRLVNLRMTCRG